MWKYGTASRQGAGRSKYRQNENQKLVVQGQRIHKGKRAEPIGHKGHHLWAGFIDIQLVS